MKLDTPTKAVLAAMLLVALTFVFTSRPRYAFVGSNPQGITGLVGLRMDTRTGHTAACFIYASEYGYGIETRYTVVCDGRPR